MIFGPPGSGKGTQAARMEREFNLAHLSTGDILRAEAASGSGIGKEAERIMRAGDLVPDDLIIRIVQGTLRDPKRSSDVLLDGFPRTLEQARALDRMLAGEGHKVDFVIALDVPEKVLVERLLHRAAVEGRADDTREAIAERMHEYRTLTAAVLDHYRKNGVRVEVVDGVGDVDEVFDRIRKALPLSPPERGLESRA
ncbi:MAG: adenylate kinase [Candidatus Dormibacteraeota bacterium]|nr:adenylate kinase [Candidatus Dormibacteraeota bacterium]